MVAPVVSAAASLSRPIHQTDAHSGDISVKVIGIKSKLLISAITVTSGRFPPHKDFCGWAALVWGTVKQHCPVTEQQSYVRLNLHMLKRCIIVPVIKVESYSFGFQCRPKNWPNSLFVRCVQYRTIFKFNFNSIQTLTKILLTSDVDLFSDIFILIF